MKGFLVAAMLVLFVSGCSSSPPKPPEPQGDEFRINNFNPITGEELKNGAD